MGMRQWGVNLNVQGWLKRKQQSWKEQVSMQVFLDQPIWPSHLVRLDPGSRKSSNGPSHESFGSQIRLLVVIGRWCLCTSSGQQLQVLKLQVLTKNGKNKVLCKLLSVTAALTVWPSVIVWNVTWLVVLHCWKPFKPFFFPALHGLKLALSLFHHGHYCLCWFRALMFMFRSEHKQCCIWIWTNCMWCQQLT